jgi:hypothetical protein
MKNHRILDFLQATIDASPELAAPTVERVRLQVRTGSGVPPKPEMFQKGYMVLSWYYRVLDVQRFHLFLRPWELSLAQQTAYHGTFAVRDADGTPSNRFKTLWGGDSAVLEIVENCYRGRPNLLKADEVTLADLMRELIRQVLGEVEIELLDPTIGLAP